MNFASTELGRVQQQVIGRGVRGSSSRLCRERLDLSTNDGRCALTVTYGIACRNLWVCCLSCMYWRCCSRSFALQAARSSLLWICGLEVHYSTSHCRFETYHVFRDASAFTTLPNKEEPLPQANHFSASLECPRSLI